jgi:hypothetical protein
MPFVNPFAAVVDGDAMVANDVNNALNDARDYVNTGVTSATDLAADAVNASDVYKPESYGYPVDGTIGTMQQAYKSDAGNGDRVTPVLYQAPFIVPWCHTWQGSTSRTTILPNLLQPYELSVVPGMSRRVYIERNSIVNMFASWSYIVLGEMEPIDPSTADTRGTPTAVYPQGAAVGSRAGSFVLAYRRADGVEWNLLPNTRRNIYPQEDRIVFTGLSSADLPRVPLTNFEAYGDSISSAVSYMPVCHFECADAVQLSTREWYDFTLLYDKGVASPSILQIVIGVRNLLIEAFPNSL